tara:strand:- start:489 stop:1262 length:774 start_codon:yes stop_codon:yes gene_type:complete
MKRIKFTIFGREPDTRKGCTAFIRQKKKEWGIYYALNQEEIKHMKELMRNYYYTPLKQAEHMVQGAWKKNEEDIVNIRIKPGPIYFEPRFEFYDLMGNMKDFSVARCICFGGDGRVHESAPPKPAIMNAFRKAISDEKLKWKRSQGYSAATHPPMDAHHKDGKEFITIYLKFLHSIKMSEEKLFAELYPEYGNFETAKIVYRGKTGWEFKDEAKNFRDAWIKFHTKNRDYELIESGLHRKITSEETKFNTKIRNLLK